MPFGKARYAANIFGFTNADPCVITVDSTQFFSAGDQVRVANMVCTTTGSQLNGDYTVSAVTNNTITITQDTSAFGEYISGGMISILEQPNPNPTPYLQANYYQPLVPWTVFNQAIGGGYIPNI